MIAAVMGSVIVIILPSFFMQAGAKELLANNTVDAWDSMDSLIDDLADKLFHRALEVWSHCKDLDKTTLEKGGSARLATPRALPVALEPQAIPRLTQALPGAKSSSTFSWHLPRISHRVVHTRSYAAEQELGAASAGSFAKLVPSVPSSVLATLAARSIHMPTPIQSAAMRRIYEGESVVLHAETGSGKSLAFLMPAIARLGLLGATITPPSYQLNGRMLIIAPTRELAVQLANDAALVLPAPGAVQIVVVGAKPDPDVLQTAAVIIGTTIEISILMDPTIEHGKVWTSIFEQLRVVVLDEMDMLLPVVEYFGVKAAWKKKLDSKRGHINIRSPTENLLSYVLSACSAPDMQIIAASATISRQTRQKLVRVLRGCPLGRWWESGPEIVRPSQVLQKDLGTLPRAVVIPEGVRHYYIRLPSWVKLKRRQDAKQVARPRSTRALTSKQKRKDKMNARRAAWRREAEQDQIHPLVENLQMAIEKTTPASALVFLCRSTGLTIRRVAKQLQSLGIVATPLHEAIGLEHAVPAMLQSRVDSDQLDKLVEDAIPEEVIESSALLSRARKGGKGLERESRVPDKSVALQARHRAMSEAFSARDGSVAGQSPDAPLIVTFEDMARGLHFDAVDTVFILGIPDSPSTYLHLAGRTGRYPVLQGSVVTICPGSSHEVLIQWSESLGNVTFQELKPSSDEEIESMRLNLEAAVVSRDDGESTSFENEELAPSEDAIEPMNLRLQFPASNEAGGELPSWLREDEVRELKTFRKSKTAQLAAKGKTKEVEPTSFDQRLQLAKEKLELEEAASSEDDGELSPLMRDDDVEEGDGELPPWLQEDVEPNSSELEAAGLFEDDVNPTRSELDEAALSDDDGELTPWLRRDVEPSRNSLELEALDEFEDDAEPTSLELEEAASSEDNVEPTSSEREKAASSKDNVEPAGPGWELEEMIKDMMTEQEEAKKEVGSRNGMPQ